MLKLYKKIILYGLNLSFLLYIFVIFGITNYAPHYLDALRYILKIYIGLLLVIIYNPFKIINNKSFNDDDRKIVFSSGLFLLLSTGLFSGVELYIQYNAQSFLSLIN